MYLNNLPPEVFMVFIHLVNFVCWFGFGRALYAAINGAWKDGFYEKQMPGFAASTAAVWVWFLLGHAVILICHMYADNQRYLEAM